VSVDHTAGSTIDLSGIQWSLKERSSDAESNCKARADRSACKAMKLAKAATSICAAAAALTTLFIDRSQTFSPVSNHNAT